MKSLSVLKTNWSRTSARNHKQDSAVANLVLNIHGLKFERYRMYRIDLAMAGYNPNEAVVFWQRMAAAKKGASPPELLSTHPTNATRIRKIEGLIPEAMKYYRRAQVEY